MKALIDCNNFFVSCERVFDPGLVHRPVAVLSSNDGCIVARSNEVKDLGVPMGAPAFKHRDVLRRNRVVVRSSNFALYSDMSRRVMATIREYAPGIEVYSIDEAFVELAGEHGFEAWARELRQKIWRETGIPTSIGIAPTKTLAKAAATITKRKEGVLSFPDEGADRVDEYLRQLPVGDVWGVGRRLERRLREYQVKTAYGLRELPEGIERQFNVTLRRTIQELRGIPAEAGRAERPKSMISTRSFGRPVESEVGLRESLSRHAATLASKLRREEMQTSYLEVFIATGAYEGYRRAGIHLEVATHSTRELVAAASGLLAQVYRPGQHYKKSGVMAYQLAPAAAQQLSLASLPVEFEVEEKVDGAIDAINRRFGQQTLKIAAEGFKQEWRPKHELRSPRYTTEWGELKIVG